MQVFRMKADPEGSRGLPDYLENHYVSCGLPGLGDLGLLGKAELRANLMQAHRLDGRKLERQLEEHWCFAHGMQDGDYVIVDDGDKLYLGDLGDYYYLDGCDNAEDRSGHRRGVTWLQSLQREDLQPELLAFLAQEGEVGLFGRPVTREQLERLFLRPAPTAGSGLVDEETLREALAVLKAALGSEDAERRERAAIAILQAARM
ncbi:hypothetical protein [Paenibacillus glycinis]|uniref:NERD domain-containing protein n=1 Tax=Paenibacillus glycinis TaxID=2697035 RepID=A0ABW9XWR3_9BACL|nr:hypothetical protein [Paenibacillus glycinis]NBD27159.1 hypothetical protein [Paenibacillus glycinis]